eukprot:gene10183-13700_t
MRSLVVRVMYFLTLLWITHSRNARNRRQSRVQSTKEKRPVPSTTIKNDPYEQLSLFLTRQSSSSHMSKYEGVESIANYPKDEIKKAIIALASGQNALKSMDGATHQLRNAFRDKSSLNSRFNKFIKTKSRNLKEAAKILEYITVVERGMQAAEIIQSTNLKNKDDRIRLLMYAGLQEIHRFQISENKIKCVVSILMPITTITELENDDNSINMALKQQQRRELERMKQSIPKKFGKNEMVIVISNDHPDETVTIAQILRLISSEESSHLVSNNNDNSNSNSIMVQPTILRLAIKAIEGIVGYLDQHYSEVPPLESNSSNDFYQTKKGEIIPIYSANNNNDVLSEVNSITNNSSNNFQFSEKPNRIRVLGHSVSGAVGSYIAMILDGSLNGTISDNKPLSTTSSLSKNNKKVTNYSLNESYVGLFHNRIRCIVFGPPPCVSRLIIPRFIHSIICGDDMISRASINSIINLKQRLGKALKAGAGKSSLSWTLGAGWMSDLSSLAAKKSKNYDYIQNQELGLPGRVFYIKSRKLKE